MSLVEASRPLSTNCSRHHAEKRAAANSRGDAAVTLLPAESQTLASRLRLPSHARRGRRDGRPGPALLASLPSCSGSLVTISCRRQPVALVEAVHRSKTAAPLAVPLLVGSVWGHASWRRDEAESPRPRRCPCDRPMRPRARRLSGSRRGLAAGASGLHAASCTARRRAWLQAALVPQILAIADASDHHSLVLSEEPDQLRTWCIALLKAVIALAPAAPAALRTLGKQLLQLGAAANNGGAAMLGADASWSLFVEIVVAMLLAPSIACPESYGLLVPAPLSKSTRSNLLQIASMLTRSAAARTRRGWQPRPLTSD